MVALEYFIECIEKELGVEAEKNMVPIHPGDVLESYADIRRSSELLGFSPKTSIEETVAKFVAWYKEYYEVENNG